MSNVVLEALDQALATLVSNQVLPAGQSFNHSLSRTKSAEHGDFASNVAMVAAKPAGMPPRKLAALIIEALPDHAQISRVEVAGPGFINFFLASQALTSVVKEVLSAKQHFGSQNTQNGKILVEFVSANPTGPLHVGHGRQAALGDALCRIFATQGLQVHKEFYYNDAGAQIDNLARSVYARIHHIEPDTEQWPKDGYRGDYIIEIAKAYMSGNSVAASDRTVTAKADPEDLDAIRLFAVAYLRREQDLDLKAFELYFDQYFLESSLYTSGAVEATVQALIDSGNTYEQDGALWLKTTNFGDDKDRVMRKAQGGYTYFVPDVAYHLNKFSRGFTQALNIQGTDHHGTISRVRAGLQAVNPQIPKDYPSYVLHTMVRVLKGGEEVKISKRSGSYITLRDLIEWTSSDAVRFFLLSRRPDTEFTFDVDLALEKSNDNPVYYVQYAHARACQLHAKALEQQVSFQPEQALQSLNELSLPTELSLCSKLETYPDALAKAASSTEPHHVVTYLRELAAEFHSWYNSCKVLGDENPARLQARLALSEASRQVLSNGLSVLGVSSPEHM